MSPEDSLVSIYLTLLFRSLEIYAALALAGGWISLLLWKHAPGVVRLPAALAGLAVVQVAAWYQSSLNRGLDRLWPWLLLLGSMAGAWLAWRSRSELTAAVKTERGWLTDGLAAGLAGAALLFLWFPLLERGTVSVASTNNDVAFYGAVSTHLQSAGMDDRGWISGEDLGDWARTDWYGEFSALAFAQWLTGEEPYQVAMPLMLVTCLLIAQCLARLVRRTTPLPGYLVVLVALVPISAFLFNYLVAAYFGSQLWAMTVAPMIAALLFTRGELQSRAEKTVWTCTVVLVLAILCLTYPHMMVLLVPVLLGVALAGSKTWTARRDLVAGTGLAVAAVAILLPERSWLAVRRTFLLADAPFGWPLPPISPWGLVVRQDYFRRTFSTGKVVASAILLAVALASALYLRRRRRKEWAYPLAPMVTALLASYAAVYFFDGGEPGYVQWKWISFLQPLLITAVLCSILGLVTGRRPGYTKPAAAALCIGLFALNFGPASAYSKAVFQAPGWVSPQLGTIGEHPALDGVESLNVKLDPNWETMWAAVALQPRTVYLQSKSKYPVSQPRAEWTLTHTSELQPGSSTDSYRSIGKDYVLIRSEVAPSAP